MMTSAGKSKVSSSKPQDVNDALIIKMGYLKKLKKMKKRYFVLKRKSGMQKACLEYYDNEKKFKNGQPPKRSIELDSCININQKLDPKQRFIIAVFTREDALYLVLENEEELECWLKPMLYLQQEGCLPPDQEPQPYYDHVWGVQIKPKGLGSARSLVGHYRLCLGHGAITLVKVTPEKSDPITFPLTSIRNCGHSENSFFMSVGRLSITGEGEFCMHTDDNNIAQSMHETIIEAMKMNKKEDLAPRSRTRSSSANESAKPISSTTRKQSSAASSTPASARDRCDSMPGRPRTISEGHHTHHIHKKAMTYSLSDASRPHSMYTRAFSSSPVASSPLSPGSTDSAGSSLSLDSDNGQEYLRRFGHSSTFECIHAEPAILEENPDEYLSMGFTTDDETKPGEESGYVPMVSAVPNSKKLSSNNSPTASPKDGIISPHVGSYEGYRRNSWILHNNGHDPSSLSGSTGDNMHSRSTSNYYPNGSSHSRSISTPVDVPHPYMEMGPEHYSSKTLSKAGSSIISDDSYLEMEPSPSPTSRGSSLTSRTPSTDLKFADFHLDKVTSHWIPSEDDITLSQDRTWRAHSFGSRCEHIKKRQKHIHGENSLIDYNRTRAYSIGSNPKSKRSIGIHGSAGMYFPYSHSSDLSPQDEEPNVTHHASSACPSQLSSSWSGSGTCNPNALSKLHVVKNKEDFLEMTFPSKQPLKQKSSIMSSHHSVSSAGDKNESQISTDYMVMTPPGPGSSDAYIEMSVGDARKFSLHGRLPGVPECSSIQSVSDVKPVPKDSYIEMNFSKQNEVASPLDRPIKPVTGSDIAQHPNKKVDRKFKELNLIATNDSPYLEMDMKSPSSVPQKQTNREDYMIMNPSLESTPIAEITPTVPTTNEYFKSFMKRCSVKLSDSLHLKSSEKSSKTLVPEHRRTRSDDYVSMTVQSLPLKSKDPEVNVTPGKDTREGKCSPKWDLPSPDSSKTTGSLDRAFGQSRKSLFSSAQNAIVTPKKSEYMNLDFNSSHRVCNNLFNSVPVTKPSVTSTQVKNGQPTSSFPAYTRIHHQNDIKLYRNPEKCPIDATSGTLKVTEFEAVQNERKTSSTLNDLDKGVRKTANKILNSKLSEELSSTAMPFVEENYGIVDLSKAKLPPSQCKVIAESNQNNNRQLVPESLAKLNDFTGKSESNPCPTTSVAPLVNSKAVTTVASNVSTSPIANKSNLTSNSKTTSLLSTKSVTSLLFNKGPSPNGNAFSTGNSKGSSLLSNGVSRSNSERLGHAPVIQKQLSVPDNKFVAQTSLVEESDKLSAAIRQRSLSGNNPPMTPAPRKISTFVASNSTPSLKNPSTSKLPFSFRKNKDMIPVEIGEDVLRNTITNVKTAPLPLVQLTEECHDLGYNDSIPPLVTQELNYASLDLGPPDSGDCKPRSRNCSSDSQEEPQKLHYAEIDFTKSEGLRTTSLAREYSHRAKFS